MNSPLRRVRMERGISLAQVARDLGCSVAHLSSIETCDTSASPEFAERLGRDFSDANINELDILYPERENTAGIPAASPSALAPQLKDEERYLLSCYRRLRIGQQMVLVELAALMAETAAGREQADSAQGDS